MIFPPDSFYVALAERYTLSQGDILRGVPNGRIPDPLHICRPYKPPQGERPGESRYGLPSSLKRPDAFAKASEIIHASAKVGLAMVVWQDCQLEKRANQKNTRQSQHFAGIAPIRPLTDFQTDPESIRTGQRPPLFYVPELPVLGIPEGCVDLRLIWPVQQSLLTERLTTLSEAGRLLLYDHLYWFFTARSQPTSSCPHCGREIGMGGDIGDVAVDDQAANGASEDSS